MKKTREERLADKYYAEQEERIGAGVTVSAKKPGDELADDVVVAALFHANGNVTKAAELLNVKSIELRRFVDQSAAARAEIDEALMRGVDLAVDVVFEGLKSEAWACRFAAAREMLKSQPAARRGFHQNPASVELKGPTGGATLLLRWLDPETPEPKIIDGEVIEK